jgi:hypothetical protein
VTSDKGANFFYFPLISNTFFFVRGRNRSLLSESTDEMTDLIVQYSYRSESKSVILLNFDGRWSDRSH